MLVALFGFLPLSIPGTQQGGWRDLFLRGNRALEEGCLDEACSVLEQALEILPEHAASAWQLAGAHALAGESESALAWLDRAVDWGGGEVALLDWDPDLASLRDDPRFADLLERLRERDASRVIEPLLAELAWSGGSLSSVSPGAEIVVTRGWGAFPRDMRAGETLAVLEKPGEQIGSARISPDGCWVVTRGLREGPGLHRAFLRAYDATTGDLVHEWEDVEFGPEVQFSRNGERMLIERGGGVWRTGTWTLLIASPPDAEREVLSPDGTRMLLTSRDNAPHFDVRLWDVDSGAVVKRFRGLHAGYDLEFSSDGALASIRDEQGRGLMVFDAKSGEEQCTIPFGQPQLRDASFLGASEIATIDEQLTVRILDARNGETLRGFLARGDSRRSMLDASSDGKTLLVMSTFESIEAFDACTGEHLWSRHSAEDPGGESVHFSPDGESVLVSECAGEEDTCASFDPARSEIEEDRRRTRGVERCAAGHGVAEPGLHVPGAAWDHVSGERRCRQVGGVR